MRIDWSNLGAEALLRTHVGVLIPSEFATGDT